MVSPRRRQGYSLAQQNLGDIYSSGRGVPQDFAQALKWYGLAADQGNAFAQNGLGLMYENGQGVPQDIVRAHMWFNLSGSQGHERGLKNRERVRASITNVNWRRPRSWRAAGSPQGSSESYLPAALRSASTMRSCQPGPSSWK
jgi:TPR repeat protein